MKHTICNTRYTFENLDKTLATLSAKQSKHSKYANETLAKNKIELNEIVSTVPLSSVRTVFLTPSLTHLISPLSQGKKTLQVEPHKHMEKLYSVNI